MHACIVDHLQCLVCANSVLKSDHYTILFSLCHSLTSSLPNTQSPIMFNFASGKPNIRECEEILEILCVFHTACLIIPGPLRITRYCVCILILIHHIRKCEV